MVSKNTGENSISEQCESAAHDTATLAFYEAEAPVYSASGKGGASSDLPAFLDQLAADAHILELGCGGGRDTKAMLDLGFRVDATEGSLALAQKAEERIGQTVRVMRFEELDAISTYDAIWAHACLLHVPQDALGQILTQINKALVAGGLFFANYKAGDGGGRDKFGRYFNYPSESWLRQTYQEAACWKSIKITERDGGGYDNRPTKWLNVFAQKESNL